MDKTYFTNNYPTVFIHGILGVDPAAGFSRYIYRYFGSFTKDLIKYLNDEGFETYQPGLGPFNCVWDRCCELWAYLFGGTVDYGKVHSERFGHARYGRTYPGVLKDLGTEGDHEKMHLIGHSYGGPTVCLFSSMMAIGDAEEVAATPANELSEFFKGGHEQMLASVTTLSGTNNGTSLIEFMGDTVVHAVTRGVLTANAFFGRSKSAMSFLDIYTDHYGIMEDPSKMQGNIFGISKEAKAGIDAWDSNFIGSIGFEMGVKASHILLKDMVTNPDVYYFARRASRAHKRADGKFRANHIIDPLFIPTSMLIGSYTNKAAGIEGDSWHYSDGMVPVEGQSAPHGQPAKEWIPGMPYEKGIWHNMPVVPKDHQTWAGMFTGKDQYFSEFTQLLTELHCLADV